MSIIEGLFNVFAPHECLGCGSEGSLLCDSCLVGLDKVPARCYLCLRWSDGFLTCKLCRAKSPLFSVAAAVPYGDTAKELLRQLKYHRAKAGAEVAARALAGACPAGEDIVISHIPTAQSRVRQRGYDQALLIAKSLSQRLGRPYVPLLARMGDQHQVGHSRTTRLNQMEGAFRPLNVMVLKNRHVLLVDDVLTTGATCEAAAWTLRSNGAKRVSAAVFAVA